MQLSNYNLWTALVTPFNQDLSVDFESLDRLLDEQCSANNGLLILGSTGEALNISLADKKKIIEHVCARKLSAPIMVGVGGHELEATKEWVDYLEKLDVHSYLMVTPLYSKPGDEGQYQWFKTLMDRSSREVVLYNVPGRTGKELSLRAVERLRDHRRFHGIKEASGSVAKFTQYLRASNNARVYCGDDALMPDFANAGSCGLISVASNVWPKETNLYVEKCLNKTFDAKELWTRASNSLFIASNPVPAKRILCELGRIKTKKMMPPLCAEDLADIAPLHKANEDVLRWYQDNK